MSGDRTEIQKNPFTFSHGVDVSAFSQTFSLALHSATTGHHVHWKAMVVEREQHGRKRKVKEALHIHLMTRKDGSMNQD